MKKRHIWIPSHGTTESLPDKTLAIRPAFPKPKFSFSIRFKRAPVDYLTSRINCHTSDNYHTAQRATVYPIQRILATQPHFTSLSVINYRKLRHKGNHCSGTFRDENQRFLKNIGSVLAHLPQTLFLSRA